MTTLYPLLFQPVLKDYIWGGRNLEQLGRTLPEGIIAESWEIAAHEDGTSTVTNGAFKGRTLREVHQELGIDLIGRRSAWAREREKFPLLIKLLDATQPLSVQVHPNDDYAQENEGNELGKTEMWVVLLAEEGAEVILGVKAGTTPDAFRRAITEGRLEPYLHRIPVKAGDHICVPAGSLHAIMGGLLIAEIQQNSNTTYRVYDWNRVGTDGKARALHVDTAMEVIDFQQVEPALKAPRLVGEQDGARRWQLCRNRYFVTERVELEPGARYDGLCDGETLEIWGVIEGSAEVQGVKLEAVQFTLLPAALGQFTIASHGGATLLRSYVDEPS